MENSISVSKVLRWLVYAGVFLVPLFFTPFTADILDFNKGNLLFIISGVGLVLFLVEMIRKGELKFKPNKLYIPMLLVILAAVISVAFSVNRQLSIFGIGNEQATSLVSTISFVILFFLLVNIADDGGKNLLNIFSGSLALAFVYGLLQMYGVHIFGGSSFGGVFNTVGSLNALGLLAAASLPLFLTTYESMVLWKTRLMTIVKIIGFVAALLIIIILNWIYIWIVAFIALTAHIAFSSPIELGKGKMRLFALPMAIIVIGAFLMIIRFNWHSVRSNFPIEVSLSHDVSYSIAWKSLKTKPLGYGLENFIIAYDKFRPAATVNNSLFQARFQSGAAQIPTMMAEGGIPVILAFLLLMFFIAKELIYSVKNSFGGDTNLAKLWSAFLPIVLLMFFYPTNFTLSFAFYVLLGLIVTSSLRYSEERTLNLEERGVYSLLGSLSFIVGLICALVGGYFMVNRYVANAQYHKASVATDRDVAYGIFVKSINSFVPDTRVYRELTVNMLQQLADVLKQPPKDMTREDYLENIKTRVESLRTITERATITDPADSENWMNAGYAYQNLIYLMNASQAGDAAINMYKQVLERSPANALAHLRIGNVHLTLYEEAKKANNKDVANQRLDSAEEEYKQAISLYNDYGQALYNLAAVYDRKNEVPQAIKQFEKLQSISSAKPDPSILFQLGLLYYRDGQKANAIIAWEKAVQAFPNYSNARWYLSLAYEESGDLKKAKAQVEVVARLNPDNEIVKQRLANLSQEPIVRTIPPGEVLDQAPLNNEQ